MTSITVAGHGRERATAERATVTVRSRATADDPETAMRQVAEAHGGLSADARGFVTSGAAERWQADRVWVGHSEEWVGDGKRRRIVFEAAASVTVIFIDVEALGAWIGAVGTKPVHEVGAIRWSLSDDTRAALETSARALAIRDATAKAGDFASAAGLGEPSIAEIREAGTLPSAAPAAPTAMFARGAGAAASAPVVEMEAGELEVTSSVTVRFEA